MLVSCQIPSAVPPPPLASPLLISIVKARRVKQGRFKEAAEELHADTTGIDLNTDLGPHKLAATGNDLDSPPLAKAAVRLLSELAVVVDKRFKFHVTHDNAWNVFCDRLCTGA